MATTHRILAAALLGWTIACGSPATEPAPPTAPTPEPTTTAPLAEAPTRDEPVAPPPIVPEAIDVPGEPVPAARSITPFPDAQPAGLPPFTIGRAIRLTSLEVTDRTVGERTVPSVAISDLASRARLDEEIASLQRVADRCQVLLALETFVSVRCTYFSANDEANGLSGHGEVIGLYRVGAAGDVERLENEMPLFLPGAERADLQRRWLRLTSATASNVVVTETGVDLTRPSDDLWTTVHLTWRAIAPYVRADGPLGPALTAQGLPLAPPGTTMPAVPAIGPAIFTHSPGPLVARWLALPASLRTQARLVTPGGDERYAAVLVFAPSVDPATLAAPGLRVSTGYFTEPMAEIVLARATETLEIREHAGPHAELREILPPGTIVAAVRGEVERTASELGRGHWAFVGGDELSAGWAQGRALEPLGEGCAPESGTDRTAMLRGTFELRDGATTTTAAWLAYRATGQYGGIAFEIVVHPLDGCVLGAAARSVTTLDGLDELHVTSASEGGGDTLIVVRARSQLIVIGPHGDAPVYTGTLGGNDTLDVATTHGPDGAHAYYPVAFGARAERRWLSWNGTAIEEHRATE